MRGSGRADFALLDENMETRVNLKKEKKEPNLTHYTSTHTKHSQNHTKHERQDPGCPLGGRLKSLLRAQLSLHIQCPNLPITDYRQTCMHVLALLCFIIMLRDLPLSALLISLLDGLFLSGFPTRQSHHHVTLLYTFNIFHTFLL